MDVLKQAELKSLIAQQGKLDRAATQTILNLGQVLAVPRERMPGKRDLCGILRYATPSAIRSFRKDLQAETSQI
jgi:hypothetical protein